MDDDKGTSLLIVNSEKGLRVLHSIKNNLTLWEIELDKAIKYNSAMISSASLPKARNKFMSAIQHKPFNKTVNKYCKVKLLNKIKSKIKSIFKRLKFGN